MIGNCERCPLPQIVASIESNKQAAQVARANIIASESPTQAKPYNESLKIATDKLRVAEKEYDEFVNIWRGICVNCKFGV